ncbi:MAG: A/G-specific adenine glycosylase [Bacteroidota bacterium]
MQFSETLVSWYHEHNRDLPWRQTIDPYRVWLSEIILQQTRVDQGLPYFQRFIENYPTVSDLANAPLEDVMRLWQGLGYYSRARNLHATAKYVLNEYEGNFPSTYHELLALPGVGPYTASAIASFCFGLPYAVVDGNVMRVLSRLHGISDPIDLPKTRKHLDALANQLLSHRDPATHNQAMMEFGAMLCKPANPDCPNCPFAETCVALRKGIVDQLPVKSSKTKVRDRYFNYLIFHHQKKMLLKKRTDAGIWQELHEPPIMESTKLLSEEEMRENELWKKLIGDGKNIIVDIIEPKPHKLSHQTIHSRFFIVEGGYDMEALSDAGLLIVNEKDLNKYAVPKLIEQVFMAHFEDYTP